MTFNELNEIFKNGGALESGESLFDYEGLPNNQFKEFVLFANKAYLNPDLAVHIPKCYLALTPRTTLNSYAAFKNDIGYVKYNIGYFQAMQNWYEESHFSFLKEKDYLPYKECLKILGMSITELGMDIGTKFIVYHEFAHVVQKKSKFEQGIIDGLEGKSEKELAPNQIKKRQYLEFDADWFGTVKLCHHIYEIARRTQQFAFNTIGHLEIIVELSLMFLFIRFIESSKEIEYYEYDFIHPHHENRLFYCTTNLVNLFSQIFGVSINIADVIHQVINLTNNYYLKLEGSNNQKSTYLLKWAKNIIGTAKARDSYIKSLAVDSGSCKYLSRYVLVS